MNYSLLLKNAAKTLRSTGVKNAKDDAREILLSLLDIDLAELLYDENTELETKISQNEITNLIMDYEELINLRASHFPLQYIKGYEYFCGLKFNVDENVLIPRSDTEVLVETVLAENPDKNMTVLDMCTGSGCIAISLASLGRYKLVIGTDISDEALSVAAKNADELIENIEINDEVDQQVFFYKSDMFARIPELKEKIGVDKFDIITINPPYIKSDVICKLQDEVKRFEPMIALDGDSDGLKFYKIIAKDVKDYMTPNGRLYLEIGFDQAESVSKLFKDSGYNVCALTKDLSGNDRVLTITIK